MWTLVAIDNSGSTLSQDIYWTRVSEILLGYDLRENVRYILWNSQPWGSGCNFVDRAVVNANISQRRGTGGTCPNIVAHALQARHFDRLILITDGEVSDYDVQNCDAALSRMTTPLKSECYIIAGSPNLSVTCPFSRLGETVVRTYTGSGDMQTVLTVTAEDRKVIDKIDTINTYQELTENYLTLENALTVQNMGRDDVKTRDRLLAMQARILRNMANDVPSDVAVLTTHLEAGDVVSATATLRQITTNYYAGVDESPMSMLNHLVSLCALKNQYVVSAIRSNRAARAEAARSVVAVPTDDVQTFECPISCEDDEVVLLVPARPSMLNGVDTRVVDELTNWPFHLCRYQNMFSQIGSHLGHPVGHKTALQLMSDDMPSPFTREPLIGYICTGQDASHVKATNWVLAQIFTGGKVLGNFDMWYALLVYYIKFYGPAYLRDDADLTAALERHLIYRLKNRKLNFNLTSLPEYINKLAPAGVSLWATLHSTLIKEDSLEWDATLSHAGTFDFFYYCLDLINYPLHPDVKARNTLVGSVVAVMSPYNKTRPTLFAAAIRALYQNHIWYPHKGHVDDYTDGTYIFLDGPASPVQVSDALARLPANLRSRPVDEILTAYRCFDPQKRLKDILLKDEPNPTWVKNYNYPLGLTSAAPVPICPATMRPYYNVGAETWTDAAVRVNGPLSGQISANALFINYCLSHGKYPTEKKFIKYCYVRQSNVYAVPTLPTHISAIWHQIMIDYGTLPPIEIFTARANASVCIENRVRMEKE